MDQRDVCGRLATTWRAQSRSTEAPALDQSYLGRGAVHEVFCVFNVSDPNTDFSLPTGTDSMLAQTAMQPTLLTGRFSVIQTVCAACLAQLQTC